FRALFMTIYGTGHSIHSIPIAPPEAVPFNGFYPKCSTLHKFRFLTPCRTSDKTLFITVGIKRDLWGNASGLHQSDFVRSAFTAKYSPGERITSSPAWRPDRISTLSCTH